MLSVLGDLTFHSQDPDTNPPTRLGKEPGQGPALVILDFTLPDHQSPASHQPSRSTWSYTGLQS